MVEIIKQTEAAPDNYPGLPSGLSAMAAALDTDALWARIESHITYRFTARELVWVIEGLKGDDWTPPLASVVSQVAQKWDGGAWVSVALQDGPLGLCLPSDGLFKVAAQVGAGPVPAPVSEAFRRLAEYLADDGDQAGVSEYSFWIAEMSESFKRNAAWTAKALQDSGAADMLRPYRRVS
ncbi:MAG: hypothetical protein AAF826_00300 [Pseudomonadota bacterium]